MTGCLLTQQAEESPIQRELSAKTHNRSCRPGNFSPLERWNLRAEDESRRAARRSKAAAVSPTVDAQEPKRRDVPVVIL